MLMPERGYATERLDPSLANYALSLTSGYAGGGLIEEAPNSFTVEFWVKPVSEHQIDTESNSGTSGTDGQKYVIFPAHGGDYTTGKAGMGVSVGTNGVSVYEHGGGYMPAILVWASPTPLTAWTHVAVVYNNKLPSLYINGVLVRTAGAASTKSYVYPCYQFPGGYYGTQTGGQLDEVRIWGVARTEAQIAASMNTSVAANEVTLLGYWPMNEGYGTILTDVSGHGRDIDLSAAGYTLFGNFTSTGTVAMAARAAYRYGFNGKEKDSHIGEDNYDYGERIYDARIGRWASIDMCFQNYPSISPYAFSINSPIAFNDPTGKWVVYVVPNPSGKLELQFQAEQNDNLTTLATQLGLSEETLTAADPSLSNMTVTTATQISLSSVEQVKNINKVLNNVDDSKNNCANVAAMSNGITLKDQYPENGENNVPIFNSKLKASFVSVTEDKASIGTIITYKLTQTGANNLADNDAIQFVSQLLPSLPTRSQIKSIILSEVAKQGIKNFNNKAIDQLVEKQITEQKKILISQVEKYRKARVAYWLKEETHFAVVVLKDKSGKNIQDVIQKQGKRNFKRDVTSQIPTGGNNNYIRKPTGGGVNPYYNKN